MREINPAQDKLSFLHYMRDKNVKEFLESSDVPIDLDTAQKELEYWHDLFYQKYSLYWAIADKNTDQIIGTCGFNHIFITRNTIDISYDLSYDYWGKGIMTRAISQIINFISNEIELKLIIGKVLQQNTRSIDLLKRLNFTYHHTEDKMISIDNKYHLRDVYYNEIWRKDERYI